MFRKLGQRLTFANAVSLVALFVALGGTGYAALKLPSNSVGSKQIKKNAVNSSKVAPNSLTGADIDQNSLGCQNNGGLVGDVSIENAAGIGPAFQPRPSVGASDEWTCNGKPVQVARLSEGHYVVTFPGLGVTAGQAVVTAHSALRLATVDDAAGNTASSDPAQAYGFRVNTTDLSGAAKDGDFTLAVFSFIGAGD